MLRRRSVCWLTLWCVGLIGSGTMPLRAQTAAETAANEDRWEATIRKFEASDKESPPLPGGNLFVGSSSIVKWDLAGAFPDVLCVNRGFGGSKLPDVLKYVERIVTPHKPAVVVLYCGDNDIGSKRTPEQVRDDYRSFVEQVRGILPEAKIVWISIKPSPKRWEFREQAQRANQLVRESQEGKPGEVYVDVWTPALSAAGEPQPELFVKDQLHLAPAGYAIWNAAVRPHLVARGSE